MSLKSKRVYTIGHMVSRTCTYVVITLISLVSIFPFIWMVMGATSLSRNITAGKMGFGTELINNFVKLNELIDLRLVLANSFQLTMMGTVSSLLIASLAGYGFEIFKSKWRDRIFGVMMLSMMVPFAAMMIPLFRLFSSARMLNSFIAVILPTVASIFIIFYFRQSTKSFSKELLQAARVDGLNELQGFFYIYMPAMKSSYAAAFIIVFMSYWNSFLWPLIVLQSNDKKTMTLALSTLNSSYTPDFGVIMLAIIIATLPTLILFFVLQKQFVAGMLGSVK